MDIVVYGAGAPTWQLITINFVGGLFMCVATSCSRGRGVRTNCVFFSKRARLDGQDDGCVISKESGQSRVFRV